VAELTGEESVSTPDVISALGITIKELNAG